MLTKPCYLLLLILFSAYTSAFTAIPLNKDRTDSFKANVVVDLREDLIYIQPRIPVARGLGEMAISSIIERSRKKENVIYVEKLKDYPFVETFNQKIKDGLDEIGWWKTNNYYLLTREDDSNKKFRNKRYKSIHHLELKPKYFLNIDKNMLFVSVAGGYASASNNYRMKNFTISYQSPSRQLKTRRIPETEKQNIIKNLESEYKILVEKEPKKEKEYKTKYIKKINMVRNKYSEKMKGHEVRFEWTEEKLKEEADKGIDLVVHTLISMLNSQKDKKFFKENSQIEYVTWPNTDRGNKINLLNFDDVENFDIYVDKDNNYLIAPKDELPKLNHENYTMY